MHLTEHSSTIIVTNILPLPWMHLTEHRAIREGMIPLVGIIVPLVGIIPYVVGIIGF
jgi:hypothetical protein